MGVHLGNKMRKVIMPMTLNALPLALQPPLAPQTSPKTEIMGLAAAFMYSTCNTHLEDTLMR